MDYLHDAFISFAWKDLTRAQWLHEGLRRLGYVTWYAEQDMRGGDDFPLALGLGLERSRYVFVVHSRHYAGAKWARRELSISIADEVRSQRTKVVFLRFDEAEVPYEVQQKLYLDFRDRKKQPIRQLVPLLDQASDGVIRGLAGAMKAAGDINSIRECAHRLSAIARLRGELLAVRQIGAILLEEPLSYHVTDSAAWALGDIGVWEISEEFSQEVRSLIEQCIATGNARLIDKMAYIVGEMVCAAQNAGLRHWAGAVISRHESSENLDLRTAFAFTRQRISSLQTP